MLAYSVARSIGQGDLGRWLGSCRVDGTAASAASEVRACQVCQVEKGCDVRWLRHLEGVVRIMEGSTDCLSRAGRVSHDTLIVDLYD